MVNNQEDNMQPPIRRPRAGTLPSEGDATTPSRKRAPTEMPPPIAPITPRVRKTPAAKGTVSIQYFRFKWFLGLSLYGDCGAASMRR